MAIANNTFYKFPTPWVYDILLAGWPFKCMSTAVFPCANHVFDPVFHECVRPVQFAAT